MSREHEFQRAQQFQHKLLAGAIAHQPDAPDFPFQRADPAADLDVVVIAQGGARLHVV
jgi:hypothetical protein